MEIIIVSFVFLKVLKLKEQMEMTVQRLNESKEVLKTNENGKDLYFVFIWLMFNSAKTLKKYPTKIIIDFCNSEY